VASGIGSEATGKKSQAMIQRTTGLDQDPQGFVFSGSFGQQLTLDERHKTAKQINHQVNKYRSKDDNE